MHLTCTELELFCLTDIMLEGLKCNHKYASQLAFYSKEGSEIFK